MAHTAGSEIENPRSHLDPKQPPLLRVVLIYM